MKSKTESTHMSAEKCVPILLKRSSTESTGDMTNTYDSKYQSDDYYWGKRPSAICLRVLSLLPPDRPLTLLDIGSGKGRNAVFFARNGYSTAAFDLSAAGVEKTLSLVEAADVSVMAFAANILDYRLTESFDILFSSGSLHYVPEGMREELFENYKRFTNPNGLHAFSVLIPKPFIPPAPDAEPTACTWISGEFLTHYHDWKVEYSIEEIFDCMSSGVPHQHAISRVIARKV